MTTLTREDRLALERACETELERLRAIDPWDLDDTPGTMLCDDVARVENLRRLLATGEHLVLP